jgi:hypothetical protein
MALASSWSVRCAYSVVPSGARPRYTSIVPSVEIAPGHGVLSTALALSGVESTNLTTVAGAPAFRPRHAATPSRTSERPASASTSGSLTRSAHALGRRADGSVAVLEPLDAVKSPRPRRPSANSFMLENRSAGSFSSARCTVASTYSGTAARVVRIGRGFSVSIRAM